MNRDTHKYRVVAIDDEKDILDYYREVLCSSADYELENELYQLLDLTETEEDDVSKEEVEFDLVTTTSGEEGFNIVKQGREEGRPFAVAFVDMGMPGGWDGLKTAREIRAIDPYVTIIFLTAYMDHSLSDIRNSIGDHFSFLTKPINREELHQVTLTTAKTWEQLREVRRLNKSKDDFLASISHELRTPLTAIIGNAEIILEEIGGELDHAYRSMLEGILKAGRGQLSLVNDVLDVSKIQSGRFEVNNENYSLEDLLSGVELLFQARAVDQAVTFELCLHYVPEFLLFGDDQRIHQVLVNLLGNAFKFTEEGAVALHVSVEGDRISFAVSDSGIGMNEAAQSRLFKPFEQADSSISRRFGGSGLGLSISKSLAVMMGGDIAVESEEGVGSTFTLNLPLVLSDAPVASAAQPEQQKSVAHYFKGRVLVAEDTPELQMLLKHMLERCGLTVVLAGDGQEAVGQALQQQMDLILMDMQMPVMDGIEATRMLRSAFYTAPIVALTANVMDDHRKQFEEAGADDFLSKPIDQQALLQVLSNYLEASDGGDLVEVSTVVSAEAEEIFRKELVRNANELRDALYIDNLSKIQQIAHKLKGAGSSFGYDELTHLGKRVCDAHHQEQYDVVRHESNKMLMLALEISNGSAQEQGEA